MEIQVIYEDKDIVAVNKPSGLVVHSDGRTTEPTLTSWIEEHYPGTVSVGEPQTLQGGKIVKRPGVVHRLDRETSGVIVIARHGTAFSSLKEQFQNHLVEKHYSAFVYGVVKEKEGDIKYPIGRSRKDFRLWSVEHPQPASRQARGVLREAITHYNVIGEGHGASFLDVAPKTGRTHQIRVHLKALQHPVVCDKRYAPGRPCILGFKRLALHARTITLRTSSGTTMVLEASLPEDFEHALSMLKEKNLAE